MKVTLRNLINGLLALGLPAIAFANDGVGANTQAEESKTSTENIVLVERMDLDSGELESVLAARPAHREALRERLRAWADAAEAAQMRRNNVVPFSYVVLARN